MVIRWDCQSLAHIFSVALISVEPIKPCRDNYLLHTNAVLEKRSLNATPLQSWSGLTSMSFDGKGAPPSLDPTEIAAAYVVTELEPEAQMEPHSNPEPLEHIRRRRIAKPDKNGFFRLGADVSDEEKGMMAMCPVRVYALVCYPPYLLPCAATLLLLRFSADHCLRIEFSHFLCDHTTLSRAYERCNKLNKWIHCSKTHSCHTDFPVHESRHYYSWGWGV
jgi:hypothetical protein